MEQRGRSFYRPAVLWGAAAGIATFLGEFVSNDASIGDALVWAAVGALTAGLLFARILSMTDGSQRRPRHYDAGPERGERTGPLESSSLENRR